MHLGIKGKIALAAADVVGFGAAAAILASVQARHITGRTLLVDGGNCGGLL
jgi:NAD(P)-dependent dehydrogenase (short-subunit alcohol dehydrogenase family)